MNTDPKRRGSMLARERRNNELRAEGIEEGTNKTLLSFIANSKKEGLEDKQILKNIQTFIPDVLEVINIDRVKKMIQTVK